MPGFESSSRMTRTVGWRGDGYDVVYITGFRLGVSSKHARDGVIESTQFDPVSWDIDGCSAHNLGEWLGTSPGICM